MPNIPETVVEFIDTTGRGAGHSTNEIRVNGSPVLVAEGGAQVHFGDGRRMTEVVLTLLVSEVHFTASPKAGE